MKKLLSSPAIQFKGTGFYITDYARQARADGATVRQDGKAESVATESARATKSETEEPKPKSAKSDGAESVRVEVRRCEVRGNDLESEATRRLKPRPPSPTSPALVRGALPREFERLQILAERLRQVGPLQREVDRRLQEAQLVAGVVAHAVRLRSA